MAIQAYAAGSVDIGVVAWKGVEPYDPCVSWTGTYYNPSLSSFVPLTIGTNSPSYLTPWFNCNAICGTTGRSFSGTFIPNGYTGQATLRATVKDAVGITMSTQTETIICNPSPMVVYAGGDEVFYYGGDLPGATLTNATVLGVSGPFDYEWSYHSGDPTVYVTGVGYTGTMSGTGPVPSDTAWLFNDAVPYSGSATWMLSVTGPNNIYGYDLKKVTWIYNGFDFEMNSSRMPNRCAGTGGCSIGFTTGNFILDISGNPGVFPITCAFTTSSLAGVDDCSITFYAPGTITTGWALGQSSANPRPEQTWTCKCVSVGGAERIAAENGYPSCHPAGTLITMSDGSKKKVEDLVAEDLLFSHQLGLYGIDKKYTEPDYTVRSTRLTQITSFDVPKYIKYNNGLFSLSPSHPVLGRKSDESFYKYITEIVVGDYVIDKDGKEILIEKVEKVKENTTVYLLSASPYHTYVADNIIMHNKQTDAPSNHC